MSALFVQDTKRNKQKADERAAKQSVDGRSMWLGCHTFTFIICSNKPTKHSLSAASIPVPDSPLPLSTLRHRHYLKTIKLFRRYYAPNNIDPTMQFAWEPSKNMTESVTRGLTFYLRRLEEMKARALGNSDDPRTIVWLTRASDLVAVTIGRLGLMHEDGEIERLGEATKAEVRRLLDLYEDEILAVKSRMASDEASTQEPITNAGTSPSTASKTIVYIALRSTADGFKEAIREITSRCAAAMSRASQLPDQTASTILPVLANSSDQVFYLLSEALRQYCDEYENAKGLVGTSSPEQFDDLVAEWAGHTHDQWTKLATQLALLNLNATTRAYVASTSRLIEDRARRPRLLLEAAQEDREGAAEDTSPD